MDRWRQFFCGSARALVIWQRGGRTWLECLEELDNFDQLVNERPERYIQHVVIVTES